MRRGRKGSGWFAEEGLPNPMDSVSNLADVMLVLAVGLMLALIVRWKVDIGAGQQKTAGAPTPAFTEEELDEMRGDATTDPGELQKRGEIFFDAENGLYYIIESGNTQ